MTTFGPYASRDEARADCQPVYDARRKPGGMTGANLVRLVDACQAAGVDLGTFDREQLTWLAGTEPETVQVVAGLITRAHHAGRRQEGGTS